MVFRELSWGTLQNIVSASPQEILIEVPNDCDVGCPWTTLQETLVRWFRVMGQTLQATLREKSDELPSPGLRDVELPYPTFLSGT